MPPDRTAFARMQTPSALTQREGTGILASFSKIDCFGGSGQDERSRIAVVGVDVACDRGLQIVEGMEGSASNLAACPNTHS
jgi:hypothetical protein